MKNKMKLAALAFAMAAAFNGLAGTAEAADANSGSKEPTIISEGIIHNGTGKKMTEATRVFHNVGTIETSTIKAECGGTIFFMNAESVHCTGDIAVTGAKKIGWPSTQMGFYSTPAVIEGNVEIEDGYLEVQVSPPDIEPNNIIYLGETVVIKGNVYLTGTDKNKFTPGDYYGYAGIGVQGKDARLIIEGNLYSNGDCRVWAKDGGRLEVKGEVSLSRDTMVFGKIRR